MNRKIESGIDDPLGDIDVPIIGILEMERGIEYQIFKYSKIDFGGLLRNPKINFGCRSRNSLILVNPSGEFCVIILPNTIDLPPVSQITKYKVRTDPLGSASDGQTLYFRRVEKR